PARVNVWRQAEYNLSDPAGAPTTDAATAVKSYLATHASQFGLTASEAQQFVTTNQYTSKDGVTYIYGQQTARGIKVANALFNAAVAKNGELLNVNVSFVPGLQTGNLTQTPAVSAVEAYKVAVDGLDESLLREPTVLSPATGTNLKQEISTGGLVQGGSVKAELVYLPVGVGQTKLAWKLNLPMMGSDWYETYVSAEPNETSRAVEAAVNWVQDFSYNVYPQPVESPQDGSRQVVVNPHDPIASPYSWHDVNGIPGPDFQDTRGNNVFAQEDRDGIESANFVSPSPAGQRPSGGPTHSFDYPIDFTRDPVLYTNASTTNLFYWTNLNHDIFYHYGFDEAAGNFQATNYSQLGQGNDPLYAFSQAGALVATSVNNAYMATPPDGIPPIMAMFEWTLSNPRRDGSLDGFIITHEYGHGITNRLTGGPANVGALNALQSGGMGEGWSDFFALWITQKPTDTAVQPQVNGTYVLNQPATGAGIRRFPYSFDMTINPLTMSYFNGGFPANEVHNVGEIWASALWDMNWLLIDKYGYDDNLYNGTGGNNLAMDLVIEGLRLQPANPSFLEARDAILAADTLLNKGVNHAEIWQAFSRRGFGLNAIDLNSAATTVTESFTQPTAASVLSGVVFSDVNGNGVRDGNEAGIPNVTMFLDLDGDAQLDPLEPTTVTGQDGSYRFDVFVPGSFAVAQVVPTGYQQTTPRTGNGTIPVTALNNQNVGNLNFGDRQGNPVSGGIVYWDDDGNGLRHPFETGMGNVLIYADTDGDGRYDLGEPATRTNADGSYQLALNTPGTYFVRQVVPTGYAQTFPLNNSGHQVTVVSGTLNVTFDFGNNLAEDWGDAPAPYPTLAANNGAVHGVRPGLFLGSSVDIETNGAPATDAQGDDTTGSDDEDGVVFTSAISPNATASVQVTVNLKERVTETV
ncbi:MAG: M36 family metallopeptidase, partial [Pirellulaceae bacterium]